MTEITRRRGRRPHAALGGRILAAGLGSAATLAFAALMARADAADAADAAGAPPPAPAVTATPADPPRTVVRVVVRRSGPGTVGSTATAPGAGRIPAPAPAPARATRAPVARAQSS